VQNVEDATSDMSSATKSYYNLFGKHHTVIRGAEDKCVIKCKWL